MDSRPGLRGATRRAFLKRSGLLGGALWLAAAGWEKTVSRALAALSLGDVEARRQRTYVALADAVSASEATAFSAGSSPDALERFRSWYAAQAPSAQRAADSILDDLEANFPGGSFRRAAQGDRLDFIRTWAAGSEARRADALATSGHGEARAGRRRAEQVRANAQRSEYRGDPTDFASVRPAPVDPAAPPVPTYRRDIDAVRRSTLMAAALELAAAPFYDSDPTNPESRAAVPATAI